MDKKIKFSEQPRRVKIIYGAVIAILCITAIVVGIVGAAARKDKLPKTETPQETEGEGENNGENNTETPPDNEGGGENETPKEPEKTTYSAPTSGRVSKSHSMDIPVFSTTLNEWRVHTGIDISAEVGSEVYAVADGTVSAVFAHPMHGRTIEITHASGVVSVYSNLSSDGITVNVGDRVSSGELLGVVGDTSLSELADEPHLHFEMKVNGISVNPLDYISEESKKSSLGIDGEGV